MFQNSVFEKFSMLSKVSMSLEQKYVTIFSLEYIIFVIMNKLFNQKIHGKVNSSPIIMSLQNKLVQ